MKKTSKFRSFKKARSFARKLKLKNKRDWRAYCQSKKRPKDIPVACDQIYKEKWTSWGDFLATGKLSTHKREFLSLDKAFKVSKKISKKYKIKTQIDWYQFFKKEKNKKILKKLKIPVNPYTFYGKQFPQKGGFLKIIGTNVASNLASDPARVVYCDEIDRFEKDIQGEGDPIKLLKKRTTTFQNRKMILTSTPTEEENSLIESFFNRSDKIKLSILNKKLLF